MITVNRSTDLKEVTQNSSQFKKFGGPLGHARVQSQYSCKPQQEAQFAVEFGGPEMNEPSQPTTIQLEVELAKPEESSNNDSTPPTTATNGQVPLTPTRYPQVEDQSRNQCGVWTTLWAVVTTPVALGFHRQKRREKGLWKFFFSARVICCTFLCFFSNCF